MRCALILYFPLSALPNLAKKGFLLTKVAGTIMFSSTTLFHEATELGTGTTDAKEAHQSQALIKSFVCLKQTLKTGFSLLEQRVVCRRCQWDSYFRNGRTRKTVVLFRLAEY